jgi:hypothetical protein
MLVALSNGFLAFQFRFDIDEKMALPVLLRGLSPTNSWARLKFAELNEKERKTTQLQDPQVITLYSNISKYVPCLSPS